MQFASSGSLEQVQSYVASVIARQGGVIVASSPALTTARFTKKFSVVWCLLTMVILYAVYWFVTKDQSLTVTYQVANGVVTGYLQPSGKRASRAAKTIVSAFSA